MALQVIPGVQLVYVAGYPGGNTSGCHESLTVVEWWGGGESQHFLLYFGSYNIMWITWDQWFSVSLCKGDRWTWQTRPQGETWGWECGRTGAHSASPGSEQRHINKPSTFTTNNVVRKWLRMCAEFSDLGPEEAVALLFYVVVYDTRHFLLPDFKAINADIVLDVFKWPVESIHGGSHFPQLGHELTWLRDKR